MSCEVLWGLRRGVCKLPWELWGHRAQAWAEPGQVFSSLELLTVVKGMGCGVGYPVCNRRPSSIPDLYPPDAKNMLPYPQHLWQPKMSLLLFSHPVVSDSLWPHGLQHARPPLHRSLLCRGEGACITQWSYKPCMSLGCRATQDKVFTAMVQMHALHTCWYPKFILNTISYVFKNRKITLSWTSKPMTTK